MPATRPASDRSELDGWGVEVCAGDLENREEVRAAFAGATRVLHLAHIRYAQIVIECSTAEVEHLVLVSSLRRFSQVSSASVDEVVRGEACAKHSDVPCTILRPSMIYGPGDDRNISRLAAYLRRHSWVPVFGSGRHLQQPVYVEDVVAGILAAVQRPHTIGRTYALAGPEAFSYNRLIDLVGTAVGTTPVKLHIPTGLARVGLWCVGRTRIRLGIEPEQILRLQEDKSFSIASARRDLGYAPLRFEEGLTKIYGQLSKP